jgi:hypothetical protein
MAVSAFGTQFTYPAQLTPWGVSPQSVQGLGINPYAFQQYAQNQPLMSAPLSSTIATTGFGLPQLQQVLPLLQIVPQQLQHLQHLVSVQLQEVQQLQQIVQLLPGQLQQIQQLVQSALQQHPHQALQFQPPIGQNIGLGGFGAGSPWGFGPQGYGAQPSQVM